MTLSLYTDANWATDEISFQRFNKATDCNSEVKFWIQLKVHLMKLRLAILSAWQSSVVDTSNNSKWTFLLHAINTNVICGSRKLSNIWTLWRLSMKSEIISDYSTVLTNNGVLLGYLWMWWTYSDSKFLELSDSTKDMIHWRFTNHTFTILYTLHIDSKKTSGLTYSRQCALGLI